jgi:hypothetical protein
MPRLCRSVRGAGALHRALCGAGPRPRRQRARARQKQRGRASRSVRRTETAARVPAVTDEAAGAGRPRRSREPSAQAAASLLPRDIQDRRVTEQQPMRAPRTDRKRSKVIRLQPRRENGVVCTALLRSPRPQIATRRRFYNGMLSCFFQGFCACLWRSMLSARQIRRRVPCGMITSSM